MDITEIIEDMAVKKCAEIEQTGRMTPGHNGPYHDQETEVRVSAHWIVIFSYLYQKSGAERYLGAIRHLAENLYAAQQENGTYLCRSESTIDKINGVIGAAWVIEGLIEAAKALQDDKYYEAACRAFFSQPFDEETGLWKRREVDGRILGFDMTYNHQLWFASAGVRICDYRFDARIEKSVLKFLDHSTDTFRVFRSGLIYHRVYLKTPLKQHLKSLEKWGIQRVLMCGNLPSLQYKEEGYHNFSVYAFAIIHKRYPEHPIFTSAAFQKALSYSLDFNHAFALQGGNPQKDMTGLAAKYNSGCNIYGFSYNSPAYELPLIVREFAPGSYADWLQQLMDLQLTLTYDEAQVSFCRNTEDTVTLNARVYEYVRCFLD